MQEKITLGEWQKKRRLQTQTLVEMVGCCRPVICKAKRGIAISSRYSKKIYQITGGQVDIPKADVGSGRKSL